MSGRAWTVVSVQNVPAALEILARFGRDKLRELETRLLLDDDWDPDAIDRVLAEQEATIAAWLDDIACEVRGGVSRFDT
jgi:hypothetical protein